MIGTAATFLLHLAGALVPLALLGFFIWIPVGAAVHLWRLARGRPAAPETGWRRVLFQPADMIGTVMEQGFAGLGRARAPARQKGRRVLLERFRTWPQITLAGTEAEPVVTLKARYRSPRSMKRAEAYAAATVFAAFGYSLSWLQVGPPAGATWWEQNWLAALICFGVASGVGAGSVVLFRLLLRSSLAMTFQGGGIAWGPAASLLHPRWLDKLQFWRADPRGVVLPGEQRKAEKYFPHRKAADEQRKDDKRRQKRAQQGKKPKDEPLFYQQCSEVILFIGPDLESWRPVAEIAYDEQGQWAARLASAVKAADDLAHGAGLKEAREAAGLERPAVPAGAWAGGPRGGSPGEESSGGLME